MIAHFSCFCACRRYPFQLLKYWLFLKQIFALDLLQNVDSAWYCAVMSTQEDKGALFICAVARQSQWQ